MYLDDIDQYNTSVFLGSRYGSNKLFLSNKLNFYSNFITDNKEFIILPKYKDSEQITLPSDFKSDRNKLVYVRDTKESDTVNNDTINFLVLMTMFFTETKEELEHFYYYYRKQGVEKFFMFYNGDLKVKQDLPISSDIEYIEWNFVYWQCFEDQRFHHAQVAALTTFYHKYNMFFNYCIMCDTDEYIYIKQNTIKETLQTQYQNLKQSLWVSHQYCNINWFTKTIQVQPIFENCLRSKCIHPNKKQHLSFHDSVEIPIHGMNAKFNVKMTEAVMYHNKKTNQCETSIILPESFYV